MDALTAAFALVIAQFCIALVMTGAHFAARPERCTGYWASSAILIAIVVLMVVLGGAFYSISMLPPVWQKITLFNPVVYLISGFRWSFYGISDVNVVVSAGMTLGFLALCLVVVGWIFRTGYKLKA